MKTHRPVGADKLTTFSSICNSSPLFPHFFKRRNAHSFVPVLDAQLLWFPSAFGGGTGNVIYRTARFFCHSISSCQTRTIPRDLVLDKMSNFSVFENIWVPFNCISPSRGALSSSVSLSTDKGSVGWHFNNQMILSQLFLITENLLQQRIEAETTGVWVRVSPPSGTLCRWPCARSRVRFRGPSGNGTRPVRTRAQSVVRPHSTLQFNRDSSHWNPPWPIWPLPPASQWGDSVRKQNVLAVSEIPSVLRCSANQKKRKVKRHFVWWNADIHPCSSDRKRSLPAKITECLISPT